MLTDHDDFGSSLPALGVFADSVRCAALATAGNPADYRGIDAVIVDARQSLSAARAVCRQLSANAPSAGVLAVLAAQDFVSVSLDWHVDDVLLESAGTAELYTRLRLAVARRRQEVDRSLRFGDLTLHAASYTATLAGCELDLTLTEFKLLSFLVQHAGRAFSRTVLMNEVWGRERNHRTVDVHVQRLRAKLGAKYESIIDTVRGVGYMTPNPRWPLPDAMAIAR